MEPWENLLLNNFSGAISPQLPDLAKHRIVISQEELNNQERRRKEVLRSLSSWRKSSERCFNPSKCDK
jgi:hypothetical protein